MDWPISIAPVKPEKTILSWKLIDNGGLKYNYGTIEWQSWFPYLICFFFLKVGEQ